MLDILDFMLLPFLACLLLSAITVYFGIHIIKREIIFIDIALAQIAALGASIAPIIHSLESDHASHSHDEHSFLGYLLSLAFVTIAAVVFTFLKECETAVSLEALIGIAYAIAATGAVVLLDKLAGGDVHVSEMLAGSILWVTWEQIIEMSVIFSFVGLLHYIYREKFQKITDSYNRGDTECDVHRIWDFIFYVTFGIVVVHAVEVGGLLTVFAFLIIPACISLLFAGTWLIRIAIGLVIGTVVSVSGLILSWKADVPSGPTVILCLGVVLFLALILKTVLVRKNKKA